MPATGGFMEQIAIFSLSTSKPQLMTAVFKEGALLINEVKPLGVSAREQKEKIPAAIRKLREKKFKVLVDEMTPTISAGTGASQVTLKTRHIDGRAVIIVGMERYRELKLQRMLSLPKGLKGSFEIPDSIVDIEFNGNGEEVYRVNWQDIRPEHILMILCCFATVFHNVASADYISQMTGVTLEPEEPGLIASFLSLIGHQQKKANTAQPQSLSGSRIDDDTYIL